MNKGITAEQVAKVMDVGNVSVTLEYRLVDGKYPHYQLTFDEDTDFSMHEIMALAALFGATGITATLAPNANGSCVDVYES